MTKPNSKNTPKYQHPKIILFDMDEDAAKTLEERGYAVSSASLGCPYKVKEENNFFPLHPKYSFPKLPQDYKEQEIVVIDMCYEAVKTSAEYEYEMDEIANEVDKFWVNHSQGYINPRLLRGNFLKSDFDRILNARGVFVIFADSLYTQRYIFGHKNYFDNFEDWREIVCSNWDFLTSTSNTNETHKKVINDYGATILLADKLPKSNPITLLLSKHLEEATYNCTLSLNLFFEQEWIPLLKNKYGNDVAGLLIPSERRLGWIIVLPDIKDKATFTTSLIDEVLPSIVPSLFPEKEYLSWINKSEYCLPQVKQLEEEIYKIREEAEHKIITLEQ